MNCHSKSARYIKTWMSSLNTDFSGLTIGKGRIWRMWRDSCESRWRINRKLYNWIIRWYVLRASNNWSVNNMSIICANKIIEALSSAGNSIQWLKTSISIKSNLHCLIWVSINYLIFTNLVNEKREKAVDIFA